MSIKHHVVSLLHAMKYPSLFDEQHLLAYELHLALQQPITGITPFVAYLEEVVQYIRGAGLLRILYRQYDSPFHIDVRLIEDYFASLKQLDAHIALIESELLLVLYEKHPLKKEIASFLKPIQLDQPQSNQYHIDRTPFLRMRMKPIERLYIELEQVYAFRKPWIKDLPRIEVLVQKIKCYQLYFMSPNEQPAKTVPFVGVPYIKKFAVLTGWLQIIINSEKSAGFALVNVPKSTFRDP